MSLLIYFASVVALGVVHFVFKAWKVNRRWLNEGVAHEPPYLFVGNMLDLVLKRRTMQEIIRRIHEKFPDEPVVGYYHFMSPRLIIRRQDLVERVLIRDFSHFVDRVPTFNTAGNPFISNLFAQTGQRWRAMRMKLSPMFATGKLRHMLPQVNTIADELTSILSKNPVKLDAKDQLSRFAMDVIGSCAFGIDPGALSEKSEFSEEAKLAFKSSFLVMMKRFIIFAFPGLSARLGITFMPARTESYFNNIIKSALETRRTTKIVRNDFVQQMLNLVDKGYIEIENHDPGDEYLNLKDKSEGTIKIEFNDDVMVGQSFLFLLAGFETTATTMAYMCYDLAVHPDKQAKARQEVNRIIGIGDFTYETLKSMSYLEGCMKESLRLHAPVGHIIRTCVQKYPVPGTSLVIQPGQTVVISSSAVHANPEYYVNPDQFSPERWTSDIARPPCTFLPFGDGPRICIGMRFAIMEIKSCISKILRDYEITLHPSTVLPMKPDPFSFFGSPLHPIMLNLKKIDHSSTAMGQPDAGTVK